MNTASQVEIEAGLPVEIGRIDKALGKLWEESGDTKTRASLMNLAVYTEDLGAVAENTAAIAKIASMHACRALLIFADPKAAETQARAWINAHCHLAGQGERQVCSEQITFALSGEMVSALPSVVFSHLDSDLPLYFWWQGEFRDRFDEKLWSWVDRLIYDSAQWNEPATQFSRVQKIQHLTDVHTILCDLNWARLLGTRFAIAQLFDHPCPSSRLARIQRVSISACGRTIGLLLLGWFAAQLKWKLGSLLGKNFFVSPSGAQIEFEVIDLPGAPISRCAFECNDASFEISRDTGSEWFHAKIEGGGICDASMLIASGRSDTISVLLSELGRGGRHAIYRKALAQIEELL